MIATYPLPHERPLHITVSPSGTRIAVAITAHFSGRFSDEVFLFASEDGSEICRIETIQGQPKFVEFLNQERICVALGVSSHASSEIHIFVADTGKHLLPLETPLADPFKDSIETGDFFSHPPDGSRVATYTSGGDRFEYGNTVDGRWSPVLPALGRKVRCSIERLSQHLGLFAAPVGTAP